MRVYKNQEYQYWLIGIVIIVFFYKCPFLHLLGIPCMGCGMTRAMLALIQWKWKLAFYYHPLFPIVIFVVLYYILERLGILRIGDKKKKILLYFIILCFILAYILRLFVVDSPIQFQIKESILYRIYQYLSGLR